MDIKKLASLFEIDEKDINNDELYKELQTVPEAYRYLKKLGIDENTILNNMYKIIDFVRDVKYCSTCPGTKNCQKTNPMLCTKINYINGVVDRELVPCKKILESMKTISHFDINDIDEKNINAELNMVDRITPKKEALKIAHDFIKNQSKRWLYIKGVPGTGRSFFASAFANAFSKYAKGNIAYISCPTRFQELYNLSYNDMNEFNNLMNIYLNAEFLVLDDLGNEAIKDNIRDSIIFPIIHERSAKNLMTVIVSEISIGDISELYTLNKGKALRAKQIQEDIKRMAKEEINFGDVSIY